MAFGPTDKCHKNQTKTRLCRGIDIEASVNGLIYVDYAKDAWCWMSFEKAFYV